ncbi:MULTISPECIES: hypothetical protein [unclassified Flavobacterium]|uniref:hypothetical protein n=1 Tax=unclassified Flavobacterium TaxID=196869 RepID=UPI00361B55EA
MQQFKIDPDRYPEIHTKMRNQLLLIMGLSSCIALVILYINRDNQNDNFLFYVLPLVVMGYTFINSITKNLKKQKEALLSYVLTVDADYVLREQKDTPAIRIPKSEIQEIIKYSNGSFVIKGTSTAQSIVVVTQIEKKELVAQLLAELHPLSEKKQLPFMERYGMRLSFLIMAMMLGVYACDDKAIVSICGAVLLVVNGYAFYQIQRNQNLSPKVRTASWLILVVMVSIAGVMFLKLTNRM